MNNPDKTPIDPQLIDLLDSLRIGGNSGADDFRWETERARHLGPRRHSIPTEDDFDWNYNE